jgi:hypothetical protein
MRTIGFITIIMGFLGLIGVAGADDYNQVCRAAADCEAADPMDTFELFSWMVTCMSIMLVGSVLVWVSRDD